MASLNTLRTKFGYALSAIIAFALLAFIFSLKSEMGFSSNDPVVGEINSEEVLYSEYYKEYQDVKTRSGMNESTEQQAAAISNAAWQSMISKKLLTPDFDALGLTMSEEERMAVINGQVPTQTFMSTFSDPATGIYNTAAIADFLSQASSNPEAEAAWADLNNQAREERAAVKYNSLVKAGSFVNKLEIAEGVASSNKIFSGKAVSVPYSSKPDSLYTVSDAEIKKYYQANKAQYKKYPTRSLSFVEFDFEPTEEDIVAIENTALSVSKEFESSEDLRAFVRANLNGAISNNYMSAAQLDAEELKALSEGKMYGPVNTNNTWVMSRAAASVMAPDTIGIRHIVLRYDQEALADSLLTALKGGADFAAAAQAHSLYAQTAAAGGDVGEMPFSAFTDEFIAALAPAKKGDIIKVASGDMIQLMEIYRADKPSRHYQVASVEYPVEASESTIGSLHTAAGMFSVAAKGGIENFNASADKSEVTVRSAQLANGERTVRMINDSREIARWAFGAEVGDLSEVFKTETGYVVAMLTEVDNEEYRSLASITPAIRSILIRDKKFADIAASMSGSSIEAIATAAGVEAVDFSDVTFASQYVPNVGVEPAVVGAIALGQAGLSAPIKGNMGVYVVDAAAAAAPAERTADDEKVRAQAVAEDRMVQYVFSAIQEMANIQDLRGEFF